MSIPLNLAANRRRRPRRQNGWKSGNPAHGQSVSPIRRDSSRNTPLTEGTLICSRQTADLGAIGGRLNRAAGEDRAPANGAKLVARENFAVDALVETLEARLREWKPETAAQVRERVAEVIELADHEVLDLLDEPTTR